MHFKTITAKNSVCVGAFRFHVLLQRRYPTDKREAANGRVDEDGVLSLEI